MKPGRAGPFPRVAPRSSGRRPRGSARPGGKDLTIAGVVLPGTVSFAATNKGMQDNSTLTDALCMRAIFTYVRAHFGSPEDYDRLVEAYNTQKVQLMHAADYTDFEDGDGNAEG